MLVFLLLVLLGFCWCVNSCFVQQVRLHNKTKQIVDLWKRIPSSAAAAAGCAKSSPARNRQWHPVHCIDRQRFRHRDHTPWRRRVFDLQQRRSFGAACHHALSLLLLLLLACWDHFPFRLGIKFVTATTTRKSNHFNADNGCVMVESVRDWTGSPIEVR